MQEKIGIDLIGDTHGHADKLEELLIDLKYSKKGNDNFYSHPTRKVVFLGDYIDRGPKIRQILEVVKGMADSGNAIALMGNHEYNALCYHTQDSKGGYLREHSEKNVRQHSATIDQFNDNPKEWQMYLNWFKTLPLFYETERFRAVHACWDNEKIEFLRGQLDNSRLTDEVLIKSVEKDTELYYAIDQILKGKEIRLPGGGKFKDKDGTERSDIRIKWWENPEEEGMTYEKLSVEPLKILTQDKINLADLKERDYYKPDQKPVFFGHYWLQGNPTIYRNNICCIDYSVAKKGKLAAYKFNGEPKLDNSKFQYVDNGSAQEL